MTYSATASALAPVAGMTSIWRAAHALMSMLSNPTPRRPTTRSRGATASRLESTGVRLRTINASASAICNAKLVRPVDEVLVVADVEARRQRHDRGVFHELADDDPHG